MDYDISSKPLESWRIDDLLSTSGIQIRGFAVAHTPTPLIYLLLEGRAEVYRLDLDGYIQIFRIPSDLDVRRITVDGAGRVYLNDVASRILYVYDRDLQSVEKINDRLSGVVGLSCGGYAHVCEAASVVRYQVNCNATDWPAWQWRAKFGRDMPEGHNRLWVVDSGEGVVAVEHSDRLCVHTFEYDGTWHREYPLMPLDSGPRTMKVSRASSPCIKPGSVSYRRYVNGVSVGPHPGSVVISAQPHSMHGSRLLLFQRDKETVVCPNPTYGLNRFGPGGTWFGIAHDFGLIGSDRIVGMVNGKSNIPATVAVYSAPNWGEGVPLSEFLAFN